MASRTQPYDISRDKKNKTLKLHLYLPALVKGIYSQPLLLSGWCAICYPALISYLYYHSQISLQHHKTSPTTMIPFWYLHPWSQIETQLTASIRSLSRCLFCGWLVFLAGIICIVCIHVRVTTVTRIDDVWMSEFDAVFVCDCYEYQEWTIYDDDDDDVLRIKVRSKIFNIMMLWIVERCKLLNASELPHAGTAASFVTQLELYHKYWILHLLPRLQSDGWPCLGQWCINI